MAQAKLTSYLGAHHERADAAEGIHPAAHGRDCRVHVGGPGLLSPLRPLGQLAAGDHAQPDAVFLHRLRPLFGEPYAEAGTTDRSFTGKDEDTTSGMYDFLERRYNPTAGRWLSPDPAGLGAVDPTNPQTWNRYAYVMNNPLGLIDLIGEECYAGDGNGGCYNNGSGGRRRFSVFGLVGRSVRHHAVAVFPNLSGDRGEGHTRPRISGRRPIRPSLWQYYEFVRDVQLQQLTKLRRNLCAGGSSSNQEAARPPMRQRFQRPRHCSNLCDNL